MKRGIYILLLTLSALVVSATPSVSSSLPGAITAREAFVKIPKERLDLIDAHLRLDMLDYWDADSIARVKNNMDGLSWLTSVSPDFLELRLTDVSSYQIKILPSKKYGPVVATAYTIDGEGNADDTTLFFYDAAMNPLPEKELIRLPEIKDFFSIPKKAPLKMADIEDMIPFITVRYSFSPDTDDMNARLTVGEYVDKETMETVTPYMRRDLRYLWNGSQYRPGNK